MKYPTSLGRRRRGRGEGRKEDAHAADKAAVFGPGQFCRARFAVFAARRIPALPRQENIGPANDG